MILKKKEELEFETFKRIAVIHNCICKMSKVNWILIIYRFYEKRITYH